METQTPKKGSCLKTFAIVFIGICLLLAVIGFLNSATKIEKDSDKTTTPQSETNTTEAQPESSADAADSLYEEAKTAYEQGNLLDAKDKISSAIQKNDTPEYQELLSSINQAIDTRKTELEGIFSIDEDKVENITFIMPDVVIGEGLICYPYIGIKESRKYMLLRIGFQEAVNSQNSLGFSSIKVRTDDKLKEISFNPLDKHTNVDIMGSGYTEVIDIAIKGDILTLIDTDIPNATETLVRFEGITSKTTDYELSAEQKQIIADVLEYYNYLEEKE